MQSETCRPPQTIRELIFNSGQLLGDPAIEDVEGRRLTYGRLHDHACRVVGSLNSSGFRRNDRIAIAIPGGAVMAVSLVALSIGFTGVPLNPGQTLQEYEKYMPELRAKAIILEKDIDLPVNEAAKNLGLEIIRLEKAEGSEAGLFSLSCMDKTKELQPEFAQPDDVANILLTSGTTSSPKLVPWKQSMVCWGHFYNCKEIKLSRLDRFLVVYPFYHAAGLTNIFRSLYQGCAVICTPGFNPSYFFRWLDATHPTVYSATPTMQRSIVELAGQNKEIIARSKLRLVRVGSASISAKTMSELEKIFGVPVAETYSSTEAIGMGCSKLGMGHPPGVLVRLSPELEIMDDKCNLLPRGESGEIVVRGPNVFAGYDNDPEANSRAFTQGWFRTGDLGFIDADGYLHLAGRVKEVINRGGEKIAPAEIDYVLQEHPSVLEAVAFAVPHPTLGEDIAAAVILRSGETLQEEELRRFVSERLTSFKIPSKIFFVEDFPRGEMGKPKRSEVAKAVGYAPAGFRIREEHVEPRTELEVKIAKIWKDVLKVSRVGVNDRFVELGGDSLRATYALARMEEEIGVEVTVLELFMAQTVAAVAEIVEKRLEGREGSGSNHLVPLQQSGTRAPLFLVHAVDGDAFTYSDLAKALGEERPIYAFRARKHDRYVVEELAKEYLAEMRAVQKHGPYNIAGFSGGGLIAYEMAQQLISNREEVGFLGAIDSEADLSNAHASKYGRRKVFLREVLFFYEDLKPHSWRRETGVDLKMRSRFVNIIRLGLCAVGLTKPSKEPNLPSSTIALPEARQRMWKELMVCISRYHPKPYPGLVYVFKGNSPRFVSPPYPAMGWERFAQRTEVVEVPGRFHGSQLKPPYVSVLAKKMNGKLPP
jgi:acyl-CoA synthetase (AMP-forming)/AMP-acid ligase II/thioesterase domain-containing protein/acyl carrier protein